MTGRNGQLSFSPEELQHPKQGIAQQESAAKQTYVLIIKQENEAPPTESSNQPLLDSLRKNLSNIGDDDYDSGISAASLFLKEDGIHDDSEETGGVVLPLAKRTRIHEDLPPRPPPITGLDLFGSKGVVKRNLFSDELSPITPPTGSLALSRRFAITSDSPEILQAGSTEVEDNFNTPTPSLDYKPHPAVRKIVLVSPPQYQTPPNLLAPTAAVKALYEQSPLASSTPITLNTGFNISTTSPDSGISLSTSSLSASVLTPNLSVETKPPPAPHDLVPSSVTTTQAGPGLPIETKITFSRVPPATQTEQREPDLTEDSTADKSLDTSLANIQWLGAFQLGGADKPRGRRTQAPTVATRWTSEERGRRKEYNYEEIMRVNEECGRRKRPPYSYMVLIQMALQSRADQKMTLREICKWIGDTFAFYMHTAKPGWKNSIRHNLSYYQCFVRATEDKKKHGARWTLQFDEERFEDRLGSKDKCYESSVHGGSHPPNMIPVFMNQHPAGSVFPGATSLVPMQAASLTPQQQLLSLQACLSKKRTGPTPILPRPTPVRAYALVPLHNVAQQQQQQQQLPGNAPVIFHIPANQTPRPAGSVYTGLQEPVSAGQSQKSIQPKPCTSTDVGSGADRSSCTNILRQAWLNAEVCDDDAPVISIPLATEPRKCPGGKSACPGGKSKRTGGKSAAKSAVSQGLPKPKMYAANKPKKRTRSRVKKAEKVLQEKALLAESSDSEADDQFEKGLPTPLRHLFQSPDDKNKSDLLATSTPLRSAALSSEYLPSPIRGFTPFRNSCGFDGSFLDILQEEAVHALKLIGSPQGEGHKTGHSPNTSLTEFGIFQISPDKAGKNLSDCHFQGLSRIFADFDPNFMTDADGLPIDMTNFNWSGLQPPSVSPKDGGHGDNDDEKS